MKNKAFSADPALRRRARSTRWHTLQVVWPVTVFLAVVGWYVVSPDRESRSPYRLARVERGALVAAVSATGHLSAVTAVQVGSQVSGRVKELLADFNSVVERGQVIARLDPEGFDAKVRQAQADVESAQATILNHEAQVERARAEVENARAALLESTAQTAKTRVAVVDARRDLDRKSELLGRELIPRSERDTAQAAHDSAVALLDAALARERMLAAAIRSAEAQLRVAEASLQSARAQLKQKQAALQQTRVDLDYTIIRSPVDGVVVSRSVDVGQTVAASLQAPTLFTIAHDLTKLQVETSVLEADIGRIRLGHRATFTVDAFAGETFAGVVAQIRKAAQTVQNVVTYTVVVGVENPRGKLLPGMTANVRVLVAEKAAVLKIPNAALRFRPPGAETGTPATASGAAPNAAGATEGGADGESSQESTRERLVRALGLTKEQEPNLKAILTERRQLRQALRDTGPPKPERRAQEQKIEEATRARIREMLTADQRARYDQMQTSDGPDGRAGIPGRVWVVAPGGTPRPVALTLGITDGVATEVLHGDLKEGQQVIVGLAGSPPSPTRPERGESREPRLGL